MARGGFRLSVIRGPDRGLKETFKLGGDAPTTIGREACEFLLGSENLLVSRRHAQIEADGAGYVLRDLGSLNHTRIDDRQLDRDEAVSLRDGAEFWVGPETVIRFEQIVAETVRANDTPVASVKTPKYDPVPDPSPPEEAPSVAPVERFGHFDVYESVARSDVDRVDRAVHEPSGAMVALKRITTKTITRSLRRDIRDDAERAVSWNHENIVKLVEVGEIDGVLFIATSFVDGATLDSLQRYFAKDIDPWLAAHVCCQIAGAIAHLHGQSTGFVHGYLAPRSVMLARNGDASLINLGLPHYEWRIVEAESGPDEVYRPHEARGGDRLDARADVCSLGLVLYELLVREPIDPRTKAVLREPSALVPEIPQALSRVAWRATRLNANKRFSSMAEMERELSQVIEADGGGFGSERAASWLREHDAGDR